jgi:hypothetical protein
MRLILALVLLLPALAWGQAPELADTTDALSQEVARPSFEISAADVGSDPGSAILVKWHNWPSDWDAVSFEILRATQPEGDFEPVGEVLGTETEFVDGRTVDGADYYYIVVAKVGGGVHPLISATTGPVQSKAQWFNWSRLNILVIGGFVSLSIIFFITMARSGRKLFIRKIAGLEAVDEAIGRATEMGRPILYIPGIQDMDNVQTIAAITILARVARTVADYETTLNVPVSRSLVMTTARESIKEAYMAAGRPDAYFDDMVHYLTDEQFGYVAAVDGIMVRQKPATCFYMGAFYAESLIMAETGAAIGAIQIAGTAQPAQLPFFVAACDYTLIGEELFAASAYLSGEPKQLGSLKGQDVGKGIGMIAIILGSLFLTLSSVIPQANFLSRAAEFLGRLFQVN